MTQSEAIALLDRLFKSKSEKIREMAYNRLRELFILLLPED